MSIRIRCQYLDSVIFTVPRHSFFFWIITAKIDSNSKINLETSGITELLSRKKVKVENRVTQPFECLGLTRSALPQYKYLYSLTMKCNVVYIEYFHTTAHKNGSLHLQNIQILY